MGLKTFSTVGNGVLSEPASYLLILPLTHISLQVRHAAGTTMPSTNRLAELRNTLYREFYSGLCNAESRK